MKGRSTMMKEMFHEPNFCSSSGSVCGAEVIILFALNLDRLA